LRDVVEQRRQAARFEEQIVRLREERETIHNEQKRIRENLQSLGDRAAEKELRERFVRTLNSQEDRLESIRQEIAHYTAERDQCRARPTALPPRLEYDPPLYPPPLKTPTATRRRPPPARFPPPALPRATPRSAWSTPGPRPVPPRWRNPFPGSP